MPYNSCTQLQETVVLPNISTQQQYTVVVVPNSSTQQQYTIVVRNSSTQQQYEELASYSSTHQQYAVVIRGCTRAIFSLLKQSCLLPFYFQKVSSANSKYSKCIKMRFCRTSDIQISVQRIFVDIKLSVRIQHQLRRDIYENSLSQLTNYICARTHITLVSVAICLVRALLHQSEGTKHNSN